MIVSLLSPRCKISPSVRGLVSLDQNLRRAMSFLSLSVSLSPSSSLCLSLN
ncbi:hypothetical protein ACHAXS_010342 [Conticribra weissflogii]